MDELPVITPEFIEQHKRITSDHAVLSIWLDSYNDIFSDFDSRPFSGRALSDDFINEAKKIAKEKSEGVITLKLLIPANLRKEAEENSIVKNLQAHFLKSSVHIKTELNRAKRKGFLLTFFGLILMVAANYLVNIEQKTFLLNAVRIVIEPASWYFVWTGLDMLFSSSKSQQHERDFNLLMAHAEIIFVAI